MNTVQRFFRRYIFFHNRNHDAVFAANRTPLSMDGEENGRCLCTVQDDRAGIAPEFLKVLNQGDDIASTQHSGGKSEHGLCLKLVMQIFKAHRGTIYFADSPPHGLEEFPRRLQTVLACARIVFQITFAANSEPAGEACSPSGAYISNSGWACRYFHHSSPTGARSAGSRRAISS